jgi:hypothetical protein
MPEIKRPQANSRPIRNSLRRCAEVRVMINPFRTGDASRRRWQTRLP